MLAAVAACLAVLVVAERPAVFPKGKPTLTISIQTHKVGNFPDFIELQRMKFLKNILIFNRSAKVGESSALSNFLYLRLVEGVKQGSFFDFYWRALGLDYGRNAAHRKVRDGFRGFLRVGDFENHARGADKRFAGPMNMDFERNRIVEHSFFKAQATHFYSESRSLLPDNHLHIIKSRLCVFLGGGYRPFRYCGLGGHLGQLISHNRGLRVHLTLGFPQKACLPNVNSYLADYSKHLEQSAYSNSGCESDVPPIGSLLLRVAFGFFGGFLISICGVCLYNKRRFLGASLIGGGLLTAALATGYFLCGLGWDCEPEHDSEYRQTFHRDGGIVIQKYVDARWVL